MKKSLSFIVSLLVSGWLMAQMVAGPMVGHVEFRTATIWMHLDPSIREVSVQYIEKNLADKAAQQVKVSLPGGEFNIATALLSGLEPGKTYNYSIYRQRMSPRIS